MKGATTVQRSRKWGNPSFNPRTREGCDRRDDLNTSTGDAFNPRTREGCDGRPHGNGGVPSRPFNPRTREGCDQAQKDFYNLILRSIHAPVKGATRAKMCGIW